MNLKLALDTRIQDTIDIDLVILILFLNEQVQNGWVTMRGYDG